MSEWTSDYEKILDNIRINSIYLQEFHKKRYLYLKHLLKYYRIPVIIISSINSLISVSQAIIPQKYITITNACLSLLCSSICSVELYLGINNQMESELISSKEYYLLSLNIYKVLNLNKENRNVDAKVFLEECYSNYTKLLESSCVVNKKLNDKLLPLPNKSDSSISTSHSSPNLHDIYVEDKSSDSV